MSLRDQISTEPSPRRDDAKRVTPDERLNRLYRVELVANLDNLVETFENWQTLADSACEPNVFFTPWAIKAASRFLPAHRKPQFVFVWKTSQTSGSQEKLVGFFPFLAGGSFPFQKKWEIWIHDYCFLGAPLIDANEKVECVIEEVRRFARQQGVALLQFELYPAEGPLGRGMITAERDSLMTIFQSSVHLRATTPYHAGEGDLLAPSLSGHHLRELRRQRRKLETQGQVDFRVLQDSRSLDLWLDWFLNLENSGWKAVVGTSMAQSESHTQFFSELIRTGYEKDAVRMEGLFLDGEPIAMKVFLKSPPASFAFKIAFDESLKKYSPGLQLEVESLEAFRSQPEIRWGDSCAVAGHPMAERVWHDRRVLQKLLISTGTLRADFYVSILPLLRTVKRTAKRCMVKIKKR